MIKIRRFGAGAAPILTVKMEPQEAFRQGGGNRTGPEILPPVESVNQPLTDILVADNTIDRTVVRALASSDDARTICSELGLIKMRDRQSSRFLGLSLFGTARPICTHGADMSV